MRCFGKHSLFVLVLIALGLFVLGCTSTQIGQAGAAPAQRCVDTDGGRDYYSAGTASGTLWDGTQLTNEPDRCTIFDAQGQRNVESCSGVNCRVTEWFCGNDLPPQDVRPEDRDLIHVDYNSRCPVGCAAGVCARANLENIGRPGYPCSNEYTNPDGYVNLPECFEGVCDQSGLCKSETELVCNDNIDQDLDGVIDCADNDCSAAPECAVAAGPSQIVYVSGRDLSSGEIYRVEVGLEGGRFTTDNQQHLTANNNDRHIRWPAPSLDTTKIAYQFGDPEQDIKVMDADGSNVRPTINRPPEDRAPDWSPDGRKIGYHTIRSGAWDVYVMNENGEDNEGLTLGDNYREEFAAWSPDGQKIAFASDRHGNGHYDLYIMNADGINVQRLTNGLHLYHGIDWSPDGQKIAFAAWERVEPERILEMEIYVVDADGRNLRKLTNNENIDDQEPSWSPDGRYIAFSSRRENNWDIYIMDANGNIQNEGRSVISGPGVDHDPHWIGSLPFEIR